MLISVLFGNMLILSSAYYLLFLPHLPGSLAGCPQCIQLVHLPLCVHALPISVVAVSGNLSLPGKPLQGRLLKHRGVTLDINGEGCPICKYSGWIEVLGAGMVHPNVLENAGVDSSVYGGFAFGVGLDRLAILKYGINDIRDFYTNDVRFLKQFRKEEK